MTTSTEQQILARAIQKAIHAGWDITHFDTLKGGYKHPDESEFHDLLGDWHKISPLDVIFNHDFAKALWPGMIEIDAGEEYAEGDEDGIPWNVYETVIAFQYHLQQMVVAEDRLKYLGENI